jgi:hypothetical protein
VHPLEPGQLGGDESTQASAAGVTSATASGAAVSNRPPALDELQAAAPHAPAATTSTAKVAGMARRQNGSMERMYSAFVTQHACRGYDVEEHGTA